MASFIAARDMAAENNAGTLRSKQRDRVWRTARKNAVSHIPQRKYNMGKGERATI